MRRSDRVRVVNKRGQVTIPVALRRALDIAPGDRVVFSAEEGRLIIRPVRESLSSAYGAIGRWIAPRRLAHRGTERWRNMRVTP